MRTTRSIALLLAVLPAAACTPTFDPASELKGFRLLAVKADSPELAAVEDPAHDHATALTTLLATPDYLAPGGESRVGLVVHATCTPRPGDATATLCTTLTELSDPGALLAAALQDPAQACAAPGVGIENGINFGGVEACGLTGCGPVTVPGTTVTLPTPRYELPATLSFSGLPAGDPERITGATVVDLALALDAAPADLGTAPATSACDEALVSFAALFQAGWTQHAHVVALKRIAVRGPESPNPPNVNPTIAGVNHLAGGSWTALSPAPAADPTPLATGQHFFLLPDTAGDLVESYVRVDANGVPIETKLEDRAYSWFATGGKLKDDHTTSATEQADYEAGSGDVLIWAVVRDLRGGEDWKVVQVRGQ
jgi:hypothetical protein